MIAAIAVVSEVAVVPRSGLDTRTDWVVAGKGQVARVVGLDGIAVAKVADEYIVVHSRCCKVVVVQVLAPASHSKMSWKVLQQ